MVLANKQSDPSFRDANECSSKKSHEWFAEKTSMQNEHNDKNNAISGADLHAHLTLTGNQDFWYFSMIQAQKKYPNLKLHHLPDDLKFAILFSKIKSGHANIDLNEIAKKAEQFSKILQVMRQ